ncbi:hypothetical protein GCM10010515_77180 [Streptomyces fructofermentans]|uniref:Uncharacterized protein n=1 Tax=Streptomyces fructofermentans TaxID=152141 RepID=A0A918NVJ3_9ACTN|nr:hypothetical protein GCM10010515_77180 [Streptomyces fructofermentans]
MRYGPDTRPGRCAACGAVRAVPYVDRAVPAPGRGASPAVDGWRRGARPEGGAGAGGGWRRDARPEGGAGAGGVRAVGGGGVRLRPGRVARAVAECGAVRVS